jgi:hypothetical protein
MMVFPVHWFFKSPGIDSLAMGGKLMQNIRLERRTQTNTRESALRH